jgi:hypothetical protein
VVVDRDDGLIEPVVLIGHGDAPGKRLWKRFA